MKVVCISDTHNRLGDFDIPDGDVLIHAGDFSMMGRPEEVLPFLHKLSDLPHKYKLLIAGNHDYLAEQDPYGFQTMIPDGAGIYYLEDSGVNLGGVNFYGSPWVHNLPRWAFNEDDGDKRLSHWKKIPETTDVLITHGPPHGVSDAVKRGKFVYENTGCPLLANEVFYRIRPRYHVFGHIHEGYGTKVVDDITFVNAAILNERYQVQNKPIVFHVG